jgi:hypothetical protein
MGEWKHLEIDREASRGGTQGDLELKVLEHLGDWRI